MTTEQAPPMAAQQSHTRALLSLLAPYRGLLALAIGLGVVDQLLALGAAGTAALVVGRAVTGANAAELRSDLIVLAILVVPKPVTAWLESLFAHDLAYRVLVDLRGRLYGALEQLVPRFVLRRRSGDIGATALGDIELVELFFAHTLSPLVVAIVVPVGALCALAVVSPVVALTLVPALVAVATLPVWLRRAALWQGQAQRAGLGELNAEAVDSVQGLREVVMFGRQQRQLDRLRAAGGRAGRGRIEHARRAGLERGLLDGVTSTGVLVVLIVAAALVAGDNMSRTAFPVVVVLASYAFVPMTTVATTARELGSVAAASQRILQILGARPAVSDPTDPVPTSDLDPTVSFHDVRFRYDPALPPALERVSFDVPAGSTVALVGHTGAGKSTCAALLMRWWDPQEGSIRVGGLDLRDIRQADLTRHVSLVPQDTYLFAVSVEENIRLARPGASEADVRAAAQAAAAHDFIIEELADGYATIVGERGAALSGGQRQRIALARALLANPPVLVMDEAVSNVDTGNTRAFEQALTTFRQGRTTLVVAHRRSTITTADHVILLAEGTVVDQGTDAELASRCPQYRQLFDI